MKLYKARVFFSMFACVAGVFGALVNSVTHDWKMVALGAGIAIFYVFVSNSIFNEAIQAAVKQANKEKEPIPEEDKGPWCPPHRWEWVEGKDKVKHQWCNRCHQRPG